jgi:hypothetical protein
MSSTARASWSRRTPDQDPIDVEAVSPLEVAQLAHHHQAKRGTTATVFEVREVHPNGALRHDSPVTIDLTPDS